MSFKDYLSEARAIFDRLYPDNEITEVDYEGSTIVVYTKNLELFANRDDLARQIAQEMRRRVAIRPDTSIMLPEEEARSEIEKVVPADAGLKDIYFESDTGEVVIENNITLMGSVDGAREHYFKALEHLRNWRHNYGDIMKDLITKKINPSDVDIFTNKPGDEIKTVIDWSRA